MFHLCINQLQSGTFFISWLTLFLSFLGSLVEPSGMNSKGGISLARVFCQVSAVSWALGCHRACGAKSPSSSGFIQHWSLHSQTEDVEPHTKAGKPWLSSTEVQSTSTIKSSIIREAQLKGNYVLEHVLPFPLGGTQLWSRANAAFVSPNSSVSAQSGSTESHWTSIDSLNLEEEG